VVATLVVAFAVVPVASASIDGGACLTTTAPVAACEVGSGTAKASETLLGIPVPVPLSLPVGFYLVAPPRPGDLAGLQMTVNLVSPSALGSPADISVRSGSSAGGVGLNMAFSNLPNT
jgi:hypothetical protein